MTAAGCVISFGWDNYSNIKNFNHKDAVRLQLFEEPDQTVSLAD